jgi:hypothetical protein
MTTFLKCINWTNLWAFLAVNGYAMPFYQYLPDTPVTYFALSGASILFVILWPILEEPI